MTRNADAERDVTQSHLDALTELEAPDLVLTAIDQRFSKFAGPVILPCVNDAWAGWS